MVTLAPADGRRPLVRPTDPLAGCPVGAVPILWNNVDIGDLRAPTSPDVVLDEIARLGYAGVQFGTGFPEGEALRQALDGRGLGLAEVYASIPATTDGPTDDARAVVQRRLDILTAGQGDVLTLALDLSPGRADMAGRADAASTPRLTANGWSRLVALAEEIAVDAASRGRRVAFHPHAGTFVETPDEAAQLLDATDPDLVGLCLDVGHWIVGGGDPVEAIRRYGSRIRHVHLKDVDPGVRSGLRDGSVGDFRAAIRARLFTELGAGELDLPAVIDALASIDYDGWLMVEQDSCWGPPSEAAAIGRRVLAATQRALGAAHATRSS